MKRGPALIWTQESIEVSAASSDKNIKIKIDLSASGERERKKGIFYQLQPLCEFLLEMLPMLTLPSRILSCSSSDLIDPVRTHCGQDVLDIMVVTTKDLGCPKTSSSEGSLHSCSFPDR